MFHTVYFSANILQLEIDSEEQTYHIFLLLKPVSFSLTLEPNQSLSGYISLGAKEEILTLSIVLRGA
jgi:hypothetical protein